MSEVKRYEAVGMWGEWENPNGNLVAYSGYQQLQTKLAESEARVGRLEHLIKRVLLESCDETAWPLYEELLNVYDETPTQSLAAHDAEVVEDFYKTLMKSENISAAGKEIICGIYLCMPDKLRQQQTNGE